MNTMQKNILLLILLFSIIGINSTIAQPQQLEITYEQTENGYDFYCNNSNASPYLIKINFTQLKNLRPEKTKAPISTINGLIAKAVYLSNINQLRPICYH